MPHRADTENDALKIGELPELHIVGLDDLVMHEDPDIERVARLVDRFSADGVLKNPLVVGRTTGNSRIVLDGANRITALRKLSYDHVLVQELEVFDPGLRLGCWHHAVEYLSPEELLTHAESVSGITLVHGEELSLEAPESLAQVLLADGRRATLIGGPGLEERVRQLHEITRIYHRFAYFDRVSYTDRSHLVRHYRNFTALFSFRRFTKEELVRLTDQGRRVPSGVTRVLLPKRALRFNIQLEILRAGLSLDEKEAWLQQNILEKVADKSIRFYREPTFFFDE